VLTPGQAVEQVEYLRGYHQSERSQLSLIRRYWKGAQNLPILVPPDAPREMKVLARIARVNVCKIVVDSLAQSLFVDGIRLDAKDDGTSSKIWQAWQANKLDARQTPIHRAAHAYGTAYTIVLPGDPYPVIRGVSPRKLTAVYTDDDSDWPAYALERCDPRGTSWKLYDDTFVYTIARPSTVKSNSNALQFIRSEVHDAGVVPIVRYLDEADLDDDDDIELDQTIFWPGMRVPMRGQIAPLMSLQDQIDTTTFDLLVAQHWGAFRQRYVIGWTAPSEAALIKASMARMMTFKDPPVEAGGEEGEGGIKVGEFGQTDLGGYIDSREASLKHAATLSQTPVHELVGELVNLSADALAAAEQGRDRKIEERKNGLGESHEQTLWLTGKYQNVDVPLDAEVIWRDTSARSFAATVDGLGKLVTMLGIPPEMLWERVPGVTQQDVERWTAAAATGGAFGDLIKILDAQAGKDVTNGGDALGTAA
jgi:hypothetical protein